MRAVVQRVSRASVTVVGESVGEPAHETVGEIGAGLVALVGVTHADGPEQARKLAERIWHLRVMDDEQGVMNRSVADTTGAVLVVSQFTLYGDTSKGRRPSWLAAARPEQAEPLVQSGGRRATPARGHRGHRPVPDRDGGGARQRRPGHRASSTCERPVAAKSCRGEREAAPSGRTSRRSSTIDATSIAAARRMTGQSPKRR